MSDEAGSDEASWDVMTCPECRAAGRGGAARIGNRRSICNTCNLFVQRIRRQTLARMREQHQEEYDRIAEQVAADFYPQVLADWQTQHPGTDVVEELFT